MFVISYLNQQDQPNNYQKVFLIYTHNENISNSLSYNKQNLL